MPRRQILIIALILAIAAGMYWRLHRPASQKAGGTAASGAPLARAVEGAPAAGHSEASPSPAPRTIQDQLSDALAALRGANDPAAARQILQKLRAMLRALPPKEAVRALTAFLANRADVATKLGFHLAADGSLTEAPTLRTWLLDCLGQIDRNAAADLAKVILSEHSSPDEWAISLRDYARARQSPEDTAYLQAKMGEMIRQQDWLSNPSAGFLEAFDAIVYAHGTNLTPDLAQLVSDKDNRAVAHAAYLTLDRLVQEDPTAVLSQLQNAPDAMAGREQTRANFFARADVRDPDQRSLLEGYLLDASRTPAELNTFAGLYPNANYMISNNLLTQTQTPAQADLAAGDRAALATVEAWLADPRFANLQPQLLKIQARVSQFVQQAASGS